MGGVLIFFFGLFWFPLSQRVISPEQAISRLFQHPLRSLSGHSFSIEEIVRDQGAKDVLMIFWAPWCSLCRQELSLLKTVSSSIRAAIILIAVDEADSVRHFMKAFDLPYPVLLADNTVISLLPNLGNPDVGLPFSVFIHKGVYKAHVGAVKSQQDFLGFLDLLGDSMHNAQ